MKRIFLILLFVGAAACCGAFLFLHRLPAPASHPPLSAGWVPQDALVFAQMWDAAGTLKRIRSTDLATLGATAEFQRFVGRTLRRPLAAAIAQWAGRIETLGIREAFVAATAVGMPLPRFVAGFACDAPEDEVARMLAEAEAAVKRAAPDAQAGETQLEKETVRTFSGKGWMLASCRYRGYYLIASDLELLRAALGRVGRPAREGCLLFARPFRDAIERLPRQRETLVFADVAGLRKAAPPWLPGGLLSDSEETDFARATTFAASTSIEDGRFRDAMFLASEPQLQQRERLTLASLEVTSLETRLYAAVALPPPNADPALPREELSADHPLGPLLAEMARHGIGPQQLTNAFGDEAGLGIDWSGRGLPQVYAVVPVREQVALRRIAEALPKVFPGTAVEAQAQDGLLVRFARVRHGSFPLAAFEPVLAADARVAVFALDERIAARILARGALQEATLDGMDRFRQARNMVQATDLFVYIDSGEVLALAADAMRSMGILLRGLAGPLGEWVDIENLPPGELLREMIRPTALSVACDSAGTLLESTGSLTLTQLTGSAAVGGMLVSLPQAWEMLFNFCLYFSSPTCLEGAAMSLPISGESDQRTDVQ